jgi:hypothetical protein
MNRERDSIARAAVASVVIAIGGCGEPVDGAAHPAAGVCWEEAVRRRLEPHREVLEGIDEARVCRFTFEAAEEGRDPAPLARAMGRRRVTACSAPLDEHARTDLAALLTSAASYEEESSPVRVIPSPGWGIILRAGENARLVVVDVKRRSVEITTDTHLASTLLDLSDVAWDRLRPLLEVPLAEHR